MELIKDNVWIIVISVIFGYALSTMNNSVSGLHLVIYAVLVTVIGVYLLM